jgi:hypothetical protein
MLLTLSTAHQPPGDLGYLLHKHPGKVQTFDLGFGKAKGIRTSFSGKLRAARGKLVQEALEVIGVE